MGKKNKRPRCGLCHVKRKQWEEKGFFGINCRRCNVPMIVSKDHKAKLTSQEESIVHYLYMKHYKEEGYKPLGAGLEKENTCSNGDHWSRHYRKK